jgi:hypothetical protein
MLIAQIVLILCYLQVYVTWHQHQCPATRSQRPCWTTIAAPTGVAASASTFKRIGRLVVWYPVKHMIVNVNAVQRKLQQTRCHSKRVFGSDFSKTDTGV